MFRCLSPRKEKARTLLVGTLNYSGVITSPYQYYENEDQHQKHFGEVFSEIVSAKYPDFNDPDPKKFSWKMGTLDPKWKSRYSPINLKNCGIKIDKTMMNEKQFTDQWDRIKEENIEQLTQSYYNKKYKPEQVDSKRTIQMKMAKQFDLFCYRTFIKIIYGIEDISQLKVNSQQYIAYREKDFSKPYLDEKRKLKQTIKLIRAAKADILCFQQSNKQFIQELKTNPELQDYYYAKQDMAQKNQSSILIKRTILPEVNFKYSNQQFLTLYAMKLGVTKVEAEKRLNFNKDSIYQVVGNIIVFSIHLTSNAINNPIQIEQMKQQLANIKIYFPNLYIIVGGDLNGILSHGFSIETKKGLKIHFSVYPDHQKQFTSNKKRTLIQPQRNKANILNCVTKDYIVSDLLINKPLIGQLVQSKIVQPNKNSLLPSAQHPYDHYLVLSEIKFK